MDPFKNSKLFSGMAAQECQSLGLTTSLRRYEPQETIFKEGDPGDGIYLMRNGKVQITAIVGEGEERRVLSELNEGDFFGEMAVLDDEPRSASATAVDQSELYFIPRDQLNGMLERNPLMAVSLMKEFSRRMREFNRQYIRELIQIERLTLVGKFARSIVHDFKNPLNIIGIAAELAAMDDSSPEMRLSSTQRIRKQVDRLNNMISELLEFTRGDHVDQTLSHADYGSYVTEFLKEIASDVAPKKVKIEVPESPPPLIMPFNHKRMNHVLANLINNAVDAMMPAGGIITVRFKLQEKMLVTEIHDEGSGISPEIMHNMFDAFVTYDKPNGTGLGLSICKKIVQDHGGAIEARNLEAGGASFSFTLPIQS